MTAIELVDVTAGYGGRPVVHDVSLDVPTGGWLAIVGPNGAGKSTLLKAIAGLVPHEGGVLVGDHDMALLGARELARIVGYAPQIPSMPEGLTVTDYALLGRTPHLGLLAREGPRDLDVVREALLRLDLGDLAPRRLATLSGGERQRAVLARVLAQQTPVLLLDEPTTGLDIGHAQTFLDRLDGLRDADGATVVTTLHDLTLAARYADQIALMDAGRVVAFGDPVDVLTPELLRRHYRADVEVLRTSAGHLVIAPVTGG